MPYPPSEKTVLERRRPQAVYRRTQPTRRHQKGIRGRRMAGILSASAQALHVLSV